MRHTITILEMILGWLHKNPWGWLLILAVVVGAFLIWYSEPLTWRNSEGSLASEKSRIKLHGVGRWFR